MRHTNRHSAPFATQTANQISGSISSDFRANQTVRMYVKLLKIKRSRSDEKPFIEAYLLHTSKLISRPTRSLRASQRCSAMPQCMQISPFLIILLCTLMRNGFTIHHTPPTWMQPDEKSPRIKQKAKDFFFAASSSPPSLKSEELEMRGEKLKWCRTRGYFCAQKTVSFAMHKFIYLWALGLTSNTWREIKIK